VCGATERRPDGIEVAERDGRQAQFQRIGDTKLLMLV